MTAYSTLFTVLTGALMGVVIALVIVNLLTGCTTWDREQWTEQNSCVAPKDLWHG